MSSVFHIREHVIPGQHIREYSRATYHTQEDVVKISVKQYIPLDNFSPTPGDITIICCQANSVPKELYEPLWEDLYYQLKATTSVRIRGIWVADQSHHGASYALNEETMANDPSWNDHPRDLFLMINQFRDQMPRPIIGVGHSMGGSNIVELSYMHPRLLTGVVLLDPVITQSFSGTGFYRSAYMSTFRRDVWPSRADAEASFKKNQLYQSWDPRVFDLWVKYGLRELPTVLYPTYEGKPSPKGKDEPPDKPVTLSTPKHLEVATYGRANFPSRDAPIEDHKRDCRKVPDLTSSWKDSKPFYRSEPGITFWKLPLLRPRCLILLAGTSAFYSDEWHKEFIGRIGIGPGGNGGAAEGAVKDILYKDGSHFIPLAQPKEVAKEVSAWLDLELKRWQEDEQLEKQEWEALSEQERRKLSEDWQYWVKWNMERLDKGQILKKNKL